jgi:DNA repair exonuclease SbcCD nuclease subunit
MADIHLGAHREPVLQKLEADAFSKAMDRCIELDVDFILVCGDFFHVGIPDLGVVNEALVKIKQVQKAGIPIYVIYGSHDYTPNGTSVIDILDTAGVLTKIVNWRMEEGKIKLDFFEDPKTGAKLTGISARKIGLERKYYEILDKRSLEREEGFKIFAFHSGITEFKPEYLSEMESLSISYFPKGFDYYAGGHIHERGEFKFDRYDRIVFPGPLFTGYGRDLEATAKGERRGFYVVSFDESVERVDFIDVTNFEGAYLECDVTGKNSLQVAKEIEQRISELDVDGKIAVLKVKGELSGGKTSDINFHEVKSRLTGKGAISVHLNRYGLKSKEYWDTFVKGEDISAIESKLFKDRAGSVSVTHQQLKDGAIATELLKVLRQEAKIGESKRTYAERVVRSGLEVLNLKGILEEVKE